MSKASSVLPRGLLLLRLAMSSKKILRSSEKNNGDRPTVNAHHSPNRATTCGSWTTKTLTPSKRCHDHLHLASSSYHSSTNPLLCNKYTHFWVVLLCMTRISSMHSVAWPTVSGNIKYSMAQVEKASAQRW